MGSVPSIIPVFWLSSCHWMTCNIDGAAHGAPGLAACGGLFRDKSATSLGYFTILLRKKLYIQKFWVLLMLLE